MQCKIELVFLMNKANSWTSDDYLGLELEQVCIAIAVKESNGLHQSECVCLEQCVLA